MRAETGPPRSPASWERSSEVLSRETIDGVVLLGPDGGEPFLVEGVGALIWGMLADASTLGELSDEVARITGGDPEVVNAGIAAFLDDLLTHRVVRCVS